MNIAEVILVYACIPLAVVGIVASLVFGPGASRRQRYRPGEAWAHEPVWYGPHIAPLDEDLQDLLVGKDDSPHAAPVLTARSRLAITASPDGASSLSQSPSQPQELPEPASITTARGGAHGDW